MFVAPLVGLAARGAGLLGKVERASTLAFTGSSIAGMFQGAKGNKLMQEQNAAMERQAREQQKIEQQRLEQERKWQENQLKLQKKALKQGVNPFGDSSILNNTTGTPTTPIQPPPAIYQNNYSSNKEQKNYSIFSFAKDMSLLAARNRGILAGSVLTGMSLSGGTYLADKMIREDIKRNSREIQDDSDDESVRKCRTFSTKRISVKGPMFSFVLGMSAPIISYATEKELKKDMLKDTIRKHTPEDEEKSGSNRVEEKAFAKVPPRPSKVLSTVSLLSGGGGAKGVRNLGIQIAAIGRKSGNKWTKKLGEAIIDNPNAALVASIPGGLAIVGGGMTVGDKIATKIVRKNDPEAFKYIESREEKID